MTGSKEQVYATIRRPWDRQPTSSSFSADTYRIFTQGVVWGVNSYDQWGMELGKQLAGVILKEIREGEVSTPYDASTSALLEYFLHHRSDCSRIPRRRRRRPTA